MDIFANHSEIGFNLSEEHLAFIKSKDQLLAIFSVSKFAIPITIGILLTIGIVGNVMVIYVSVTSRRIIKHPVHSLLVLNLAVADLVYLLATAPYQISTHLTPGWIYGSFMCPFLHFLNIQTMSVGIFTMSSLAIMRFLALVMPFKIQKSFISTAGNRAGVFVIMAVWAAATALASPAGHFYRFVPYLHSAENLQCTWFGDGFEEYSIAILVLTFILPFHLVVVLYFFVVRILFRLGRESSPNNNRFTKKNGSEYMRTTYMICCLIVGFLVCWFPYHLYKLVKLNVGDQQYRMAPTLVIMELVGYCTSFAHACINPIIYTFAAPTFRQSIAGFFTDRCTKFRLHITKLNKRHPTIAPAVRRCSPESTRMFTVANQEALNRLTPTNSSDPDVKRNNLSLILSESVV